MDSGRSRRSQIVAEEMDFWGKIADERFEESELRVPTVTDLADPFVESSDRRFLELIGNIQDLSVLDIGCGKGSLSLYTASKGAHVTGLDISRGMVARCRARSTRVNCPAEFVVGDAEALPFKDSCFDRVIGQRTIHHFQDLRGFFEEVDRVLAHDGRAVFIEPQKRNPFVEVNRKLLQPEKRTAHEHPLVPADVEAARKVFPSVKVETFYLVSPLAWLFRSLIKNDFLYRRANATLQAAERPLTAMKTLQPYCWQIVLAMAR